MQKLIVLDNRTQAAGMTFPVDDVRVVGMNDCSADFVGMD